MDWIKGKPKKAMWCLAAYLTNDTLPAACVTYLWFNPHAIDKWCIGILGRSIPFRQTVTHWMPLPDPPK